MGPVRWSLSTNSILNGERIYQRLCYNCHGRQSKGDNNAYMESIGYKPADHTDLANMQTLSDWESFLALRDGVKDGRGWYGSANLLRGLRRDDRLGLNLGFMEPCLIMVYRLK